MKKIVRNWKVGNVKGVVKYDKDSGKVIVEFPFPKGKSKRKPEDVHIFKAELKEIAERAYQLMEYVGREFYTIGKHTIEVKHNDVAIFKVNALL